MKEPEVQPQKPLDDNFVLKEVPQGEIFLFLQLNTITYNKIYEVLFLFEALYSSYFYKSSFSILNIFYQTKNIEIKLFN